MSICVLGDRDDHDTFDLGAEWLKARLAIVPPDLMAAVDGLMLGDLKLAAHMLGIVFETPKPRTFASFFERSAGDGCVRAEEASVRLLRQPRQSPVGARRDRARSRRRGRRQGRAARLSRRVLGEVRVSPDLARGGRGGSEGADRRDPSALVRGGLPARRAGLARGRRARRGGEACSCGVPLARGADRARDARISVRAAPRHPHARVLPELVDAPLGARLGTQGHEDLLLPDRSRSRRRARHRPRWLASTRRSATRAGCGCCGA